jgi:hypothetical protein
MSVSFKCLTQQSSSNPATKKYGSLPSWERYIEMIDSVERTEDEELFIDFKSSVFRLSVVCGLTISQKRCALPRTTPISRSKQVPYSSS